MVSTQPLISKSSSPCINPFVTVLSVPITIGITVIFMLHSFFQFPIKVQVLIPFSFFQFYSVVSWNSKVYNPPILFLLLLLLLLIIIRSCRLAKIRWSVCISKSQRSLCVSFSRTDSGLCIYHLFVWSNLNFLHSPLWIILSTQSCLVLYFFFDDLLHLLIMWLIILTLSPHNLHLLFFSVLSILALIW